MADALAALDFATRDGSRESLVTLARAALAILHELSRSGSIGPERMEEVGAELAENLRRNPVVRVPSHVVLLARTLGLLSGVARSLDTHVDPIAVVLPYVVGSQGRAAAAQPASERSERTAGKAAEAPRSEPQASGGHRSGSRAEFIGLEAERSS
jgi:predicted unusual protein kinase regulating ubiquinone biosynthesis (AarF/ABC1/UbiB family)